MRIIGWMRQDKLFSYWLVVWVVAYVLGVTSYNPKLFLQLALVYELILLGMLFYYKNSGVSIALFVLEIITIKLLPLYALRATTPTRHDLYAGCLVALVYVLYVRALGTSPMRIYAFGIRKIKRGDF